MILYLVRHGIAENSAPGGDPDRRLTQQGTFRTAMVAKGLKRLGIELDRIVSSPYVRARQTAEIIAKKTQKPILFEEGLVEINWGEAEGTPHDPTKSIFDDAHKPKGAELFSAFQKRVIEAVSSTLAMGKLPLIVSHGGVFKALMHYIGYKNMSSSNCTPFFCKPPIDSSHPWGVCNLSTNS